MAGSQPTSSPTTADKRVDFTNLFLPLTLRYKTETDLLGFTGGFTRDNTLMSRTADDRRCSALYTTEPMDGQSVLDQAHH